MICESEVVICRAGYSSIMDLAVLQKKVFLIPTKNQTEQEYLANYLKQTKGISYVSEENFSIDLIKLNNDFVNLKSEKTILSSNLFRLFKGE